MSIQHALFWGCAAVCTVAELLILIDVFAPARKADVAPHIPQSPKSIEILWAVLPAIGLVALFWVARNAVV